MIIDEVVVKKSIGTRWRRDSKKLSIITCDPVSEAL